MAPSRRAAPRQGGGTRWLAAGDKAAKRVSVAALEQTLADHDALCDALGEADRPPAGAEPVAGASRQPSPQGVRVSTDDQQGAARTPGSQQRAGNLNSRAEAFVDRPGQVAGLSQGVTQLGAPEALAAPGLHGPLCARRRAR